MGILHGQSRCRASDRGAESKINGRKMRSKSRSRELSLKGHFWTPYLKTGDTHMRNITFLGKGIGVLLNILFDFFRNPWIC